MFELCSLLLVPKMSCEFARKENASNSCTNKLWLDFLSLDCLLVACDVAASLELRGWLKHGAASCQVFRNGRDFAQLASNRKLSALFDEPHALKPKIGDVGEEVDVVENDADDDSDGERSSRKLAASSELMLWVLN